MSSLKISLHQTHPCCGKGLCHLLISPGIIWHHLPSLWMSLLRDWSFFWSRVFDHGLKEKLPPTDSRLRPDQRDLENGEYERANLEKQRLEKRQRMSRKIQESGWKPRWFRREGENGTFRYVGGYWEAREHGRWDGCPNTFGEFNEDSTDPLGAS